MKENDIALQMQKEYARKKIVKLIDNLGQTLYKVHPSQIYKLYSFDNACAFIQWAKKNKQVAKLKSNEQAVDIEIDLRCVKTNGLVAC